MSVTWQFAQASYPYVLVPPSPDALPLVKWECERGDRRTLVWSARYLYDGEIKVVMAESSWCLPIPQAQFLDGDEGEPRTPTLGSMSGQARRRSPI